MLPRAMVAGVAIAVATVFVVAGSPCAFAQAQDYPTRAVTIVSPTTSGTGSDIMARQLAPRLQQKFGRPFVVENRTGASGNIGVGSVAKGNPDGYLIMVAPSTMAITPLMSKDLGWDPVKDLQPIARLAFLTLAMVAHSSVPAGSVSDFVALAKQKPGAMNYASPGSGTPHQLAMELLKLSTGIEITHIPYKGSAGAVTDLLGGRVQAAFFPVHAVLPHVKSGKLKFLGTLGEKRTPWSPEVPTLPEQGVSGVEVDSWIGMFAPRGTPMPIVERLSREVLAMIATQEIRDAVFEQGIIINPGAPEELQKMLIADLERFKKVITQAKLTLD